MGEKREHPRLLAEDIIDTVRESLIILDERMHVLSANHSFYEKFKVSPDETENQLIYNLGNGQWNIPELRYLLEEIIPHKSTFNDFKVQHYFESIGRKVMLLNGRLIIRKKGEPALILLAIEDITEIDATQKKLEDSEVRYRKLVEGINSIIIGFTPAGEITFFNHFAEKLFGYDRTEVLGKSFIGTIIPCVESTGKSNAHICKEIVENPQKYYVNESEGLRKDGSRVFFSWSAKATYDEIGKIKEILIDGTDLTDVVSARKKFESESSVLQTILEFIPVGLMIVNQNHVVQNASKSLGDVLNIPKEKICNTNEQERLYFLDLYFPDGTKIKPNELPLAKSINTGKAFFKYETVLKVDGKTKNLLTNSTPIRDKNGNVVGAIGIWEDVTETSRIQNELKKSEERFRRVYDSNMLAIAFWKADGKLTEANKAFCDLIGFTPEEVLAGKIKWIDFTPPDILWRDQQGMDEIAKTGVCTPYEKIFIHRNGHTVPVVIGGASIAGIKDQGVAFCIDLTNQKRIQEQLRKERNFNNAILQTSGGLITVINRDGLIVRFNKACEKLTHYTEKEAKNQSVFELFVPPEERIGVQKVAKRLFEGELVVEYENHWVTKTGEKRYIRWRNTIIRSEEGSITFAVATGIDITDIKQTESELRKSEERFRTLADNISQLAWMADENGNIYWYNERWYEYTGFTKEDMKGDGWKKVHHPEYLQKAIESFSRSIKDGIPWEFTFPMKNAAGEFRWFLTRAMPIFNENQKIIRWFGTNTDVTELRNLQQQLENERELLQTIIDTIPIMITLYDPQIQKVETNKAFEKITGWSAKDAQKKPLIELVYPDPKKRKAITEYMQSLATGFKDIVMTAKNGDQIDSSWANVRIPDGRQIGIGIDIRERLRAEQEIKVAAERFKMITSSNIIGFEIADFHGNIHFANDYFLKVIGYTREEFDKKTVDWIALTPKEHLENDYKALEQLNLYGRAEPYEKQFKRRDGKEPWVLLYNIILPGEEERIFSFVLDITERKHLENQLKNRIEELAIANKDLESFSYSVAHDLRNPLKTISSFINFLEEDCSKKLNEECLDYVKRIDEGAIRMNSIIDDILALSKISRQEMEMESIHLTELAWATVNDLRRNQPNRIINFTIEDGIEVHADKRLMSVVFTNLIGNAWKYTAKTDHPRIEFGMIKKGDKDVYYVKDNGAGFDMKHADKLFVPFKRLHSEKDFSGTGVGLAIVEKAISRHGGKIWATSEPGKGATFFFTLKK